MPTKPLTGKRKTYTLQILLDPDERRILARAARIATGQKHRVGATWARGVLLAEAARIVTNR